MDYRTFFEPILVNGFQFMIKIYSSRITDILYSFADQIFWRPNKKKTRKIWNFLHLIFLKSFEISYKNEINYKVRTIVVNSKFGDDIVAKIRDWEDGTWKLAQMFIKLAKMIFLFLAQEEQKTLRSKTPATLRGCETCFIHFVLERLALSLYS